MAYPKRSVSDLRKWWKKYEACGYNVCELARREGGSRPTWESRIEAARSRLGHKVPENLRPVRKRRHDAMSAAELRKVWDDYVACGYNVAELARTIDANPVSVSHWIRNCRSELGVTEPQDAAKPHQEPLAERQKRRFEDRIARLESELRIANRELNEIEDARTAIFNLVADPVKVPSWGLVKSRGAGESEMPVLFASDWQYGEKIRPELLGGFNAFDPEIANERVRLMASKAIELSFSHRGKKSYPGVYYLRGGDMISGEIHEDLRESNSLQSCASARELVQIEAWLIRELKQAFGKVHVISIPGNHGRTTEKPRTKAGAYDNFDVMTHFWLEDIFRGDGKVTFDAPPSGEALFQIYGYQFALVHGDRSGSKGGQGFLGVTATILRGMKKVFDYYATLGVILDYILVGHHHTALQLEYGLSNGCLPGYSEYAMSYKMRPAAPQQWMLYVHPDLGICDSKSLILGPRPKISAEAAEAFPTQH